MIKAYSHFYDAQCKRYLMQMVRAFSGFQYQTGQRGTIAPMLKMVPCQTARRDKVVAAIQRNLSENTLLSVPMITVDMTNLVFDMDRLQNPHFAESIHAIERARDPISGKYNDERGNAITIDRLMPRPFTMEMQIDIWTSNQEQKAQLLEQILMIVCPSFEIQNSDNVFDWSALTTALYDGMEWTSRAIPIGESNEIDVATIRMKIPMWINPPAMIKRQTLIEEIITNINEADVDENGVILHGDTLVRRITTPGNHCIRVANGFLTLLGPAAQETDDNGDPYSWEDLFRSYKSHLMPAETQIKIRSDIDDDTNDIVGTIQGTDQPNVVEWQIDIDTLPANTLSAIHAVINPLRSVPGDGDLPSPTSGRRYLITEDLGGPTVAWGAVTARAGSIIQYTSGAWVVSFNSATQEEGVVQYLVNQMTSRQLKWDPTTSTWILAIDQIYGPGQFRIGNL